MASDEDRIAKLKRDVLNGGTVPIEIHITAYADRTMRITGPSGDRQLFLLLLAQATDAVRQNARDRGELIVPGEHGAATPRPEGYI